MTKYQKPVCDCGNELLYSHSKTYYFSFKITNDGQLYKKKYESYDEHDMLREKLECETCNNYYEVDYDENGKIIRGNAFFNNENNE